MPHLKKTKIAKLGAKATTFVAKRGLKLGLQAMSVVSGPIAWVLSFLGNKFIENKIAPHAEALAIKALWRREARQFKRDWRKLGKISLRDMEVEEFKRIRKVLRRKKKCLRC